MIRALFRSLMASPPAAPREASPAERARELQRRISAIVEPHVDGLWRFARRLGVAEADIDDVMQEVIMIVAGRIDDIREGSEKSFLFSTFFRVASDARRARARQGESGGEPDELPHHAPSADRALEDAEARAALDRLLASMAIELRAVFVLHEIEEHTMAEIAEELNLAPGTVASRLRRARTDFEQKAAAFEASMRLEEPS